MKKTIFCRVLAIGGLSVGALLQPVAADGPADLEALAEKARQAAGDLPKAGEKEQKPVAEAVPEKTEPKQANAKAGENKAGEEKAAPVDLEKRAEKLGLLSSLSKDVSAVLTFTNGERLWGEVEESAMGQVFLDILEENEVDFSDPDSPGAKVAALFGEEFLLAVGKGTPKQAANLLKLNNLNEKYQTALMMRLWTIGMADEELFMDAGPFGSLSEAIRENPDFLVNLIASAEMPPILIASRISDAEQRDEVAALLQMGAGMALEFGAEEMPFMSDTSSEVGGINFSGLQIDGEVLIETLQEEMDLQQVLGEFIDPAGAQDMINSLKKKDLVLMSGVSGEAVYLYLGSRAEDIPLAKGPAERLTASDSFSFADPYLNEDLVSVLWMEQDLLEATTKGQPIFGNYIEGIRLGLQGNQTLGNPKELKKSLAKLQKLEKNYLATYQYQPTASVSFLRADGLHAETFGGLLEASYDWTTPHQLGSIAEDSFLTVQLGYNRASAELETDYIETAFEAVYQMAGVLNDADEPPAEFQEFLEGFDFFNDSMKDDALALWKGLLLTDEGVGTESIMEVDLAGSWPTVPGVPEEIVQEGLAPRISIVSSVKDRAKLGESWKQVEGAASNLLKTVSEKVGENIPMQKPMSSQTDGLKTWFFPFPMQTDDFVPSVTLDDEVMVMSTSKERAVALAKAAKKRGSGKTGIVVEMRFDPLRAFLADWLALVDKNPEGIIPNAEMLEFYQDNKETIAAVVESLAEFDRVTSHTRLEDGQLRTTTHFKTK
ncbi:hypothetical protein AAFN60_06710 [Roseibacillus persicicus]|uniref:hypothetical protein n=1 Tax=Roseibacillus persicicus TaxID=454148 RepID=UPI00398B0BF2